MSLFFEFAISLGLIVILIVCLPVLIFSVLTDNLENSEKASSSNVDYVLIEF